MKRLIEISEQITERINQFIEDAENNESLLDTTIGDMKKRIDAAKDHVATTISGVQRLKFVYQEAVDKAKMWDELYNASLHDGDNERAAEAKRHKQQHLQRAKDLEQRIHSQEAVVTELKAALRDFYIQIKITSEHVESLTDRKKLAETRAAFYKLLAEFDLPDNHYAIKQAEEELQAAETEAKKWEKLIRTTPDKHETTEKEFDLDEALAELKSDILGNSQND